MLHHSDLNAKSRFRPISSPLAPWLPHGLMSRESEGHLGYVRIPRPTAPSHHLGADHAEKKNGHLNLSYMVQLERDHRQFNSCQVGTRLTLTLVFGNRGRYSSWIGPAKYTRDPAKSRAFWGKNEACMIFSESRKDRAFSGHQRLHCLIRRFRRLCSWIGRIEISKRLA